MLESVQAVDFPADDGGVYWVGFGASAGGLEALRTIARTLPTDAQMTYIVAQHLAPQHRSILTELLSRETTLTVAEIYDGVAPKPNTIYVTPENHDVLVDGDRLRLVPPSEEAAAPKPSVDRFLMSLAAARGERAVAVILSGTGSDGAYGIKAVRAAGGITIAQDAASARHYGMPWAALSTDNVDLILPAHDIGPKFREILDAPSVSAAKGEGDGELDAMGRIYHLLHTHTKNDFRGYKAATVQRRIERRMQALAIHELGDYVAILSSSQAEISALFQDLLVSVTSFFRDPEEFSELSKTLRRLAVERGDAGLRLWVAGCATGEEAYTLAMLAAEAMGGLSAVIGSGKLKVFATDLDQIALSTARQGVYPEASLDVVPTALRDKYFDRSGPSYAASRELRSLIVFSPHNILQDPPFLNIDVLSCRNVLIYFDTALQERVFARFHYSLNSGGALFLGKSEATAGSDHLFKRAGLNGNIFIRRFASDLSVATEMKSAAMRPVTSTMRPQPTRPPVEVDLFDALVSVVGPNALLVDAEMHVMKSFGDVSAFTTLAPGSVSTTVNSLVVDAYRHEVRLLAHRAGRDKARCDGGVRRDPDDPKSRTQVQVHPLHLEKRGETLLLIVFASWRVSDDAPSIVTAEQPVEPQTGLVEALERELAETRENLQQTVEELETTNEELQAANEELQTSNEEYQSTNEELETSNEELQSTNEELITVNDELNTTSEELRWATRDLEHILEQTPTPIIVVDRDGIVTRLSNAARTFFAIPAVLESPHISQVAVKPGFPSLHQIVTAVAESDAPYEHFFENDTMAARIDARRYAYGRSNEVAVVIAIVELTELMRNRRELQRLFDLAPAAILEHDARGAILRRNAAMAQYLTDERMQQLSVSALPASDASSLRAGAAASDGSQHASLLSATGRDGVTRWLRFLRRTVDNGPGALASTYLIGADVTELVEAEQSLLEQTSLLKLSQRLGRIGHWRLEAATRSVYWSDELYRLTGEDPEFFRPTADNMLQFYNDEDRAAISQAIEAAISDREPFALTAALKSRSGVTRSVDWSARPEIAADGSVSSVIGIVRDMTMIHERENELRRIMEELARSNAELSRFSYVCSHDMREPVRTIASMVQLLIDDIDGDDPLSRDERRNLIQRVDHNAGRLLQIIEGLLEFSRLEGAFKSERIDLAKLIREVEAAVKPAFADKDLIIETVDPPIIWGHTIHIRQLFQNLIVNALKFSVKTRVKIVVSCAQQEKFWRFNFSDDGPGVPKEFRDDIFMMFRRLNRKDEAAGSGLGLGICKRIVEQHGGEIYCEASKLGGAAFVFSLGRPIQGKNPKKGVAA